MKFKFRAWLKNEQKMVYGEEGFFFEGDGCIIMTYIQATPQATPQPTEATEATEATEPYIVMQYTNLDDTDGNELYDGDIIYDDLFEEYGVIFFDEGSWMVTLENLTLYLSDLHYSCELAGNIYENPKLLKEAK